MEGITSPDVGQLDIQPEQLASGAPVQPQETLALQIAKSILESIRAGQFPIGARLPSEQRLADTFRVSRNTMREAIRLLIAQGVLMARKGVGTFVHGSGFSSWPVETGMEELMSTTDIIASAGHVPGSRDYRLDRAPAKHELASALSLDAGSPLYRLSRVRLADDEPVMFCQDYLPVSLVREDVIRRYTGSGSLLAFLEEECGLSIAVARTVLKPVLPDKTIAAALGVSRSIPLLLLKQTHFDAHNQPFLYSDNYVNSSLFEFHVRRMPSSFFTSHPASQLSSRVDSPASSTLR